MLRLIEDKQVRALLDRAEALEIVEAAYRAAAEGGADVSQPSAMHLRGRAGTETHYKVKGAVLDAFNVAGFRLIADTAPEVGDGSAYVYVLDAVTGQPLGLVAEPWLHRIRTASTGLVACRKLLPKGAQTLALVGTGRIAEEFVLSCQLALPGLGIVVASRSHERARMAADQWRSHTSSPVTSAPIREAVSQADVVVTLSDASECLFKASDLKPHALVCAMGGRHEFDSDVLASADAFVVDELDFVCTAGNAAHWIRSGQLTRDEVGARVDATIGELLAGHKQIERTGRILAIIQGMAICDLAIAKTVLDRSE